MNRFLLNFYKIFYKLEFLKISMNSSQSHLIHPKSRRDIDGLRALAVLAVGQRASCSMLKFIADTCTHGLVLGIDLAVLPSAAYIHRLAPIVVIDILATQDYSVSECIFRTCT